MLYIIMIVLATYQHKSAIDIHGLSGKLLLNILKQGLYGEKGHKPFKTYFQAQGRALYSFN